MLQHFSWGCEMPSLVNPHMMYGMEPALALQLLCAQLLTKEETLWRATRLSGPCKSLQALGDHAMPPTLVGQHSVSLKPIRIDMHTLGVWEFGSRARGAAPLVWA